MANERAIVDLGRAKITNINHNGPNRQTLYFKVLYKYGPFSNRENKETYKFIIGDETSNIVLLGLDDARKHAILKENECYKMYPGGATSYPSNAAFPQISNQPHRMQLSILDISKIIPNQNAPFLNSSVSSQLNLNFTPLEVIGRVPGRQERVGVDIIAKVFHKINTVGDAPIKQIKLVDIGRQGKNAAVNCKLRYNHVKKVAKKGIIVAIFNASVIQNGNDIEPSVGNESALFELKTIEDCWMLSPEQKVTFQDLLSIQPVIGRPGSGMRTRQSTNADQMNGSTNLNTTVNNGASTSQGLRPSIENSNSPNVSPNLSFEVNNQASKSGGSRRSNRNSDSITGTPPTAETALVKYKRLIRKRPNAMRGHTLKNVRIVNFILKRYLGCYYCTSSLKVRNDRYFCPKCIGTENQTQPRRMICYLLTIQGIADDAVEHQEVDFVCYNSTMVQFMGNPAEAFDTDMDALEAFRQKVLGRVMNIKITYSQTNVEKPKFKIELLETISTVPYRRHSDDILFSAQPTEPPPVAGPSRIPSETRAEAVSSEVVVAAHDDTADLGDSEEDDIILNDQEMRLSAKCMTNSQPIRVQVVPPAADRELTYIEDEMYDTFSGRKGLAVLITISEIMSEVRKGALEDRQMMNDLFKQLGFKVMEITNVKSSNLLAELDKVKSILSAGNFSSLFVCLSTHGRAVDVVMADKKWVNLWEDLIYRFDDTELPGFIGRPKVFLIQRCQTFKELKDGDKANLPSRTHAPSNDTDSGNSDEMQSTPVAESERALANHPNLLVFSANSPGHTSKRCSKGSYFFRTIAEVFMKYASNRELRELLKMVSRIMFNPPVAGRKQISELKDYLFVKKYYFNIPNHNGGRRTE